MKRDLKLFLQTNKFLLVISYSLNTQKSQVFLCNPEFERLYNGQMLQSIYKNEKRLKIISTDEQVPACY